MPPKNKNRRTRRPRPVMQKGLFTGRAFKPTLDPKMFKQCPWWDMTVNFEDPYKAGTAYYLTPANIRNRVLNNLGITANAAPNFVFRLKTAKFWSVADASSQSVSLSVKLSSLIPTVSDDASPTAPRAVYYGTLCTLQDTGTLNVPAAVGWKYSMADQAVIIPAEQSFSLAEYSAGGNGYMRVLFNISISFNGTSVPPD